MSKFQKRLSKLGKNFDHALVVGSGFGHLEDLLEILKTVFVIDRTPPLIKSKKLIYRENFDNLSFISNINFIVVDLENIRSLDLLKECWVRNNSYVLIEGDSPIEREFSKSLYSTGWGCTSTQGTFHVWEKIK